MLILSDGKITREKLDQIIRERQEKYLQNQGWKKLTNGMWNHSDGHPNFSVVFDKAIECERDRHNALYRDVFISKEALEEMKNWLPE